MVASLSACAGETEELPTPETGEDCVPRFEPPQIAVGVIATNRPVLRPTLLANRGSTDCTISDVQGFGLSVLEVEERVIRPNEALTLLLMFTLDGPSFIGRVEARFESGEFATASLFATGSKATLSVAPNTVNFSNTSTCPARPRQITVFNTNNEAIDVRSAALLAPSDELTVDTGLPTRLSPGSSLALNLSYRPLRPDLTPATLEIISDQTLPARVEITGTGSTPCD